MNPLLRLKALGQSPWLDYLDRGLLREGGLARLIAEDGICGVTSNPTILARAFHGDPLYRQAIARLRPRCRDPRALYEALVFEDVRLAADLLRPLHEASGGLDGQVSLEVSPALATSAGATIEEAQRLWRSLDRPNVMIKVPATRAGLEAIRTLVAAGVNVNVTLLFSVRRYREVAEAWLAGLEARLAAGRPVAGVVSVASLFVSRIDTLIDRRLDALAADHPQAARLRGAVAIAVAKTAWARYRELTGSARWARLAAAGARPQRLLWASTSTKDPRYPDTKYVDALIGAETVTTLPPQTLAAYRDHGDPAPRLAEDLDGAQRVLSELASLGIDVEAAAAELVRDGVARFADSWRALLTTLADGATAGRQATRS